VLAVAAIGSACGDPEPGTAVTSAMLEAGKATYITSCAPCHGTSGRGDGPSAVAFKPRDHTDATVMEKLSDADIAGVIREGGAPRGMPFMPAQPQIRGADLVDLVAYVRSLHRDEVGRLRIEADDWR